MEVAVNPLTGCGSQPPRMRLSTNYRRTRLLLKKSSDQRISCDTKDWIKGSQAYYIQCILPLAKGFVCVKEMNRYRFPKKQKKEKHSSFIQEEERKKETTASNQFKVCVKGSGSATGDESCYFMLFRLHPSKATPEMGYPCGPGPGPDTPTVSTVSTTRSRN